MQVQVGEFKVLEAFYPLGGEADLADVYTYLAQRQPKKAVDDADRDRVRRRISDLCLEGYLVRQKRGRYSLTHQGNRRFLNEIAHIAPDSPVLAKERGRKSVVVEVQVEALEDGGFLASCPAIQGCHAEGNPVGEALENLEDVARIIFQLHRDEAWPLPDGLEEFAPNRVLSAELTVPLPERPTLS